MSGAAINVAIPRGQERDDLIARTVEHLDPYAESAENVLDELAHQLVDAVLAADLAVLETGADALQEWLDARDPADDGRLFGACTALLTASKRAIDRLPPADELPIREDTTAWHFLVALDVEQRYTSTDLRKRLDTSDSQISRTGRQLMMLGLVAQRRAGRHAYWHLTTLGRQLVRQQHAEPRARVKSRPPGAVLLKADRRPHRRRAPSAERFVVPTGGGRWRLATQRDKARGRTYATRDEAIARGRQRLFDLGGGVLHVFKADGTGDVTESVGA